MKQKEIPGQRINHMISKKGGVKMALLAAPHNQAFCIDESKEDMLHTTSTAILDALLKIRKAEASSQNAARLQQLDWQIHTLQNKKRENPQ